MHSGWGKRLASSFVGLQRRAVGTALAAGILVLGSSPHAWAFRTIEDYPDVPGGARVRWEDGSVEFQVYEHGIDSVDAETLAQQSRQALLAWAATPCARIAPNLLGISLLPAAPDDGVNTIEIIDEDWEALGFPADAAGANDILFEERDDGSWAIVEADIYINAEHHRWTTSTEPQHDERSLLGVLTHETGHALGLLHPCEPDGADGAPSCNPDDAPNDLMSPYYASDQVYPESEDYAGLCYLYSTCETEGCATGFRCQAGQCVSLDADGDGQCDEGFGGQSSEDCSSLKRPFGDECTESNQCQDGECVAGVEDTPICTRRCGTGEPDCPREWSCSKVEDRQVCLPPNPEAGCSCSLERPQRRSLSERDVDLSLLIGIGLSSICIVLGRFRARRSNRAGGRPMET